MPLLRVSVKMEVCLLGDVYIFPRDLPTLLILLLHLPPIPPPNIMASLHFCFHAEMWVRQPWEVKQIVPALPPALRPSGSALAQLTQGQVCDRLCVSGSQIFWEKKDLGGSLV